MALVFAKRAQRAPEALYGAFLQGRGERERELGLRPRVSAQGPSADGTKRRVGYAAIALLSALLAPPDIIGASQMLIAIPLMALYELSSFAALFFWRRQLPVRDRSVSVSVSVKGHETRELRSGATLAQTQSFSWRRSGSGSGSGLHGENGAPCSRS